MLELKLGPSAEFLSQLARRKVASAMTLRLGIAISEKELDEAVAAFYAERKLFGPQQLLDWRHSMRIDMRVGARADGTLSALQMTVLSNTGAYGNHGSQVLHHGSSGNGQLPDSGAGPAAASAANAAVVNVAAPAADSDADDGLDD